MNAHPTSHSSPPRKKRRIFGENFSGPKFFAEKFSYAVRDGTLLSSHLNSSTIRPAMIM